MIKISFQALVRMLVDNKLRFVIERTTEWKDNNIFKFIAVQEYPDSFVISDPTQHLEISLERNKQRSKGAEILLIYDIDNSEIVGCCNSWKSVIQTEIDKAKSKKIQQTAIVLASTVMNVI